MPLVIDVDEPGAEDVRALLEVHLAFARRVTPPEGVFALDLEGLLDPSITFFGARLDGRLVGVGALRRLDEVHAEVKSMHTVASARGQGIGRAMLDHLLAVAADRGCQRVSLETGVMDAFSPARSLYARAGFTECDAFGSYQASRTSTYMTITLGPAS